MEDVLKNVYDSVILRFTGELWLKKVCLNAGANRMTRYTPTLTIVLECNRADTGVGATMAPSSQLWKGNWADLVKAAKQSSASDRRMIRLAGSASNRIR